MARYFVECAYHGGNYSGWQIQQNAKSVQGQLEEAFSTFYAADISITGCGRTDTGVHASEYFFHFNLEVEPDSQSVYKLNSILPKDIAIKRIFKVKIEAHARFDAICRSYVYQIHRYKSPFKEGLSYYYPRIFQGELDILNEYADLLKTSVDFTPFCKTGSDVKTHICQVKECNWKKEKETIEFHITADRFLRGMVRLIVGAGLNLVLGKITLDEIKNALEQKTKLSRNLSVPAHGLYLCSIDYPSMIHKVENHS